MINSTPVLFAMVTFTSWSSLWQLLALFSHLINMWEMVDKATLLDLGVKTSRAGKCVQ